MFNIEPYRLTVWITNGPCVVHTLQTFERAEEMLSYARLQGFEHKMEFPAQMDAHVELWWEERCAAWADAHDAHVELRENVQFEQDIADEYVAAEMAAIRMPLEEAYAC